ncbi:MAG: hypothetical protein ABI416_16100 [Ginsengibacter sp.]
MKTLLIILVSIGLSLGAVAQRKGYHGVYHGGYHSRIYFSPYSYSFGLGYPYFGYGYPYYGYPYGYTSPYGYNRMPYKLSLEIQSIKTGYRDKIRETRKDKSLRHSQRRKEIRSLKTERDQEIIGAQRNFSRRGRLNNPRTYNNSSGDNS